MTPSTQLRFGPIDLMVAVAMNLMWGLNIIAVKMGVSLVSPMTAAFLRQAMVLVICLPALRIMPGRMRTLLWLGLLSGVLFYIVVNLSFAVTANVSTLAIAGQLGAPFSLLLAVLVLGERIHKYRIIGMALAFLGVVLLVFDPAAAKEIPGLALTVVASILWAICSLLQRNLKGVPVLTIYAWVGLVGTMGLFPVAFLADPESVRTIADLPLSTLGWIGFSALGSTIIGQGAMSWLLQRHPVSTVVPMTLPTPVISVVAGSLFFDTPLTPVMMLGGAIALVGVGIVTIRTALAGEDAD
jgi:O-acetylserine/cysteine efflux transporter